MKNMSYLTERFKIDIMRRVYVVHACRAAAPLVAETVILGAVVWGLTVFVSFSHVLANMPSPLSGGSYYGFMTSAFVNTELPVYILSLVALGLLLVTLRTVWKLMSPAWNNQPLSAELLELETNS